MELKNGCNSPKDMVSGELLSRILGEEESACRYYGGYCGESNSSSLGRYRTRNSRMESGGNSGGSMNGCTNNDNACSGSCRPDDYGCGNSGRFSGLPLAMVYSVDQEWHELYEDVEALERGTMFKELDLPFYPGCKSCK